MLSIIGVCDWCKQSHSLIKHEYIDGKANYSCQACYPLAKSDVRRFNLDELASRQREMYKAS